MTVEQIEQIIRVEKIKIKELGLLGKPHIIHWSFQNWEVFKDLVGFYGLYVKDTQIVNFMGLTHRLNKRIKAWKVV